MAVEYWSFEGVPVTVDTKALVILSWDTSPPRRIGRWPGFSDSLIDKPTFDKMVATHRRKSTVKTASFRPSRLQILTSAYVRRLHARIPTSAFRAVSDGMKPKQVEERIARALSEGRPDPEWEKEIEQARALPADGVPKSAR